MRQIAANPRVPPAFAFPYRHERKSSGTRSVTATFDPVHDFGAKEIAMNKDRVAGATKEAVGGIKEKAGKALGDTEVEVEGKAKEAEGKVQNAAGKGEAKVRGPAARPDDAARRADKGRWTSGLCP